MAEITSRRIGELLRIVFELLWYHPEGLSSKDIFSYIVRSTRLTEYEMGYLPSMPNVPRYEMIIRLATNPLVKAGWMVKNNKGRWYITDDGRQACKQFTDAAEFYKESTRLYNEYYKRRRGRPSVFLTLEEAREETWEQIKSYIQEMRPFEFKALMIDLLRALGYHLVWLTPSDKNRVEIDMVAHTDPLGVSTPRIMVQIKHKGQALTVEGLKTFLAILGPDDFGLLVSTGGFTNDVKEYAVTQKNRKFALLDIEEFFDLWLEHYGKFSTEALTRLPLEPVYFLSPLD